MAQNLPNNIQSTAINSPGQQNLSHQPLNSSAAAVIGGGRFDFDDGGTYCGGWHDGKAHGHGICTGPKGQGEYSGSWHYGFEVSGVYKWPSGATYEGQWQNGKRHGLGVEYRGKWVYKGEWTQGYKGRYGIRASLLSNARYEGTWANGLQDGYGSETYADGGTYQGQWLRGMRHGYGVRTSAPYGHSTITKMAKDAHNKSSSLQSLNTEGEDSQMQHQQGEHRDAVRGGFVLVAKVSQSQAAEAGAAYRSSKRRNSLTEKVQTSNISLTGGFFKGLRLRKQRSTGDLDLRSHRNQKSLTPSLGGSREESETRSTGSNKEMNASQGELGSNASFLSQDAEISDPSTVEVYNGEWKNDKRSGYGVCERSDGLRYEGEWYNNKKYGYGVTTFPDGSREEGKYKNNILITNIRKKHLFMMRSNKLRERIESSVAEAHRSQQIALQKCDIAASRTATARSKSEQADYAASAAQNDSQMALIIAKQYGGADLAIHGQGSIAPLRRRLSDFSQVRRMREGPGGQGGVGGLFDQNPQQQPNSNSNNQRQFLDPNEPFGGRRGSFRSQMLNSHNDNNNAQHHHHSHGTPSLFPGSGPGPMNHPNHGFGYPHMNPGQNPAQNRFGGQQQQQHSYGTKEPSSPNPKDTFSQAFSDHFDHYQRNGTPDPSISGRSYLSGSRGQMTGTPTTLSTFNGGGGGSGGGGGGNYSPTPSPSPIFYRPTSQSSNYSQSPNNQSPIMENNIRPSPTTSGGERSHIQLQSIPPLNTRNVNNNNSTNIISYTVDKSHQTDVDHQPPGVRHLRTASLYRPTAQLNPGSSGAGPSGSGGAQGGGGFKRKPSWQPNMARQTNIPLMSREEASILSHQQREQRRQEQEYRERLAKNPLLYLWSPNLLQWLNSQKLVILVFLINVSIAYLFIRMIVS